MNITNYISKAGEMAQTLGAHTVLAEEELSLVCIATAWQLKTVCSYISRDVIASSGLSEGLHSCAHSHRCTHTFLEIYTYFILLCSNIFLLKYVAFLYSKVFVLVVVKLKKKPQDTEPKTPWVSVRCIFVLNVKIET